MANEIQGGFGVTVTLGGTALFNLLEDVEFPEQERLVAQATPHNATGGYAQWVSTGKRQLNEFTIKLGWNKTSHAPLTTAIGTATASTFTIATPNADETMSFSGFVTKIARVSEEEGSYSAEVTIQPTGAPTIT